MALGPSSSLLLVAHFVLLSLTWFVVFPVTAFAVANSSRWSRLLLPLTTLVYIFSLLPIIFNPDTRWKIVTPAVILSAISTAAHTIAAIRIRINSRDSLWLKRCSMPTSLSICLWYLPPLTGLAHILLSAASVFPLCDESASKQCLAHWSIGYVWISYGLVSFLTFWLTYGPRQDRLHNADNWFFFITGLMNIFGEHWNETWTHEDMQHTAMGFILASSGLLGIIQSYLSRSRTLTTLSPYYAQETRTSRVSFVFPVACLGVGWAMATHGQGSMFATHIHKLVGVLISLAGILRFIESLLQLSHHYSEAYAVRQASCLSVITAGTLFIGATDREISLLTGAGVEPISYILTLSSISILLFALASIYHSVLLTSSSLDEIPAFVEIESEPPFKSLPDDDSSSCSCSTLLESPV